MSLFDPRLLFPIISVAFLASAWLRHRRGGRRPDVAVRIRLRLALLFGLVALGLWIFR